MEQSNATQSKATPHSGTGRSVCCGGCVMHCFRGHQGTISRPGRSLVCTLQLHSSSYPETLTFGSVKLHHAPHDQNDGESVCRREAVHDALVRRQDEACVVKSHNTTQQQQQQYLRSLVPSRAALGKKKRKKAESLNPCPKVFGFVQTRFRQCLFVLLWSGPPILGAQDEAGRCLVVAGARRGLPVESARCRQAHTLGASPRVQARARGSACNGMPSSTPSTHLARDYSLTHNVWTV